MKYEIGTRIRMYREKRNLSQKDLAAYLGISSARLSNWEQGINRPDVDILPVLCRTLDITPNELLNFPSVELSDRDLNLIRLFNKLDAYGKKAVESLLQVESERCADITT